jgi:hypothetical protein
LRFTWPELVASAGTLTAWHCGTDAPSVSAPGAGLDRPALRSVGLQPGSTSTRWAMPGLAVRWLAAWQHLDPLRFAGRGAFRV